ncbi:MAG: hypothetical protein IPM29_17720 [Planctomycetes bacterium]|nr:hypothetical protein [Planctomycetota bacterium]
MNIRLLPVVAAAALAATTSAQIALRELATVNLDVTSNSANPEYIGSNPITVAWDGTDLYVGGFNASGATANTAVIRVSNALTAPSFGTPFGVLSTPNLRGYSGLDVSGGAVAAAYDDGAADPNGIALYDASGTQLWAKNARGGSGVGFDPGFPGGNPAQGQGVAWTTFGSGRRALQDTATGADIWTTATGMIILTSEGTFWRDVDFDDATGDVYLREGNNVIRWVRSGDNSVTSSSIPFNPADADFVNAQNIAFCQVGGTQALFFNDRSQTAGGQRFFDVVKVIDPAGNPLVVDWGGFTAADGVGAYDFSYDAASGTLAIVDYANRSASIFAVTETCATLATTGSGLPGTNLVFALGGAFPNALAALLLTGARAQTTLPIGTLGTLELGIATPFIVESMGVTDGNGDASLSIPVPLGLPPVSLVTQAFAVQLGTTTVLEFCVSGVAENTVGQ